VQWHEKVVAEEAEEAKRHASDRGKIQRVRRGKRQARAGRRRSAQEDAVAPGMKILSAEFALSAAR